MFESEVPFIDDNDEATAEFEYIASDFFIEFGDTGEGVDDEEDDVGVLDGIVCSEGGEVVEGVFDF